MPSPEDLQRIATFSLNACADVAAASMLSRAWLARAGSAWAATRVRSLRHLAIVAMAGALLANCAVLWLEAALMAGVDPGEAGSALPLVLHGTHYGMAWTWGAVALLVAAALQAPRSRRTAVAGLAALAAFFYTRTLASHAAADGDATLAVLADWIHLVLASLWVGGVAVAAFAVLPARPTDEAAWRDTAGYVRALSGGATVAVAGIVATGVFNAVRNLGGIANATGNPYAKLLLAKVALVLLAAALGGANRFLVMPALLAGPPTAQRAQAAAARFVRILRIETVVLLSVLALAALLASTAPPGMG